MSSFLEISCTECGTKYNAGMNDTDVSILFKCVRCKAFNLYHLGRTVALDSETMLRGTDTARETHIRQRLEDRARAALLETQQALPRILNINVDVAFAQRLDPPNLERALEAFLGDLPEDPDEFDKAEAGGFADQNSADANTGTPISDAELEEFRHSLNTPDFWRRIQTGRQRD